MRHFVVDCRDVEDDAYRQRQRYTRSDIGSTKTALQLFEIN